jgi:hypothetical protein
MLSALKRITSYAHHSKSKSKNEIDTFVKEMKKKLNIVNGSIDQLDNTIEQIQTAVSKSSPELGLDPQMEPLISAFINNVEDRYNKINDCIAQIKNFEAELFDAENVEILLSLTDSSIAQAEKLFNKNRPTKNEARSITSAKKLQKEAYASLKNNKKDRAAKLTSESYYSIIYLTPSTKSSPGLDEQYEGLVKSYLDTEKLLPFAKGKKAGVLFSLSEKHLKNAIAFMKEENDTEAQKEIDICSLLITKTVKTIMAEHKDKKKK